MNCIFVIIELLSPNKWHIPSQDHSNELVKYKVNNVKFGKSYTFAILYILSQYCEWGSTTFYLLKAIMRALLSIFIYVIILHSHELRKTSTILYTIVILPIFLTLWGLAWRPWLCALWSQWSILFLLMNLLRYFSKELLTCVSSTPLVLWKCVCGVRCAVCVEEQVALCA